VLQIEKVLARRAGAGHFVTLHVQADPDMTLHDAHELGGRVRSRIVRNLPAVLDALIHMEPFEGASSTLFGHAPRAMTPAGRKPDRPQDVGEHMKPATRRRLRAAARHRRVLHCALVPVVHAGRFPAQDLRRAAARDQSCAWPHSPRAGTVERIVLNMNQGGATYIRGGNAFIILSAGYLGSLLWGLLLIEVAGRAREARALGARRARRVRAARRRAVRAQPVRLRLHGRVRWRSSSRAQAARRAASLHVLLVLGLTSALYALLDIRSDILSRPHVQSDAAMLADLTGVPTARVGLPLDRPGAGSPAGSVSGGGGVGLNAAHRSAVRRPQQRSTSATLHACAMQPRGANGSSASKISAIVPTTELVEVIDQPAQHARAPVRGHRGDSAASASMNGPISQPHTVP
jgi:hypothetical protein